MTTPTSGNLSTELTHVDVLIVGAGLSGLIAAHTIKEQFGDRNLTILLIDKGRSVGGRLATRRIGPGRADHGAQFFTVRTPDFERLVDQWLTDGHIYRWSTGWSRGSLDPTTPNGFPRYATHGGMNNLAKHLAQGLNIQVNEQLTRISRDDNLWQAVAKSGRRYSSHALLLTPPVPQSLTMLDAGDVWLNEEDYTALERIRYAPCLAGMFWVDGKVDLPEPGAAQCPTEKISWIADNQRKGISPEARLVTVHTGSEYSQELWPRPENEALEALTDGLRPFLAKDAKIIEVQLKRWRYALPTALHSERFVAARNLPPLVFAGDAFGEARVEGAALSGMAGARKLIDLIKTQRR